MGINSRVIRRTFMNKSVINLAGGIAKFGGDIKQR